MTVVVANNTKSGYVNPNTSKIHIDAPVTDSNLWGTATPKEFGDSPIHEPTYVNDAAHLMVLDKNWVILVLDKNTTLFNECDSLDNDVGTEFDAWLASNTGIAPNPSYTNRSNSGAARRTVLTQARVNIGEPILKTATTYDITSADDSNYSLAQNPSNVDMVLISKGDGDYERSPQAANPDDVYGDFPQGSLGDAAFYYCYINFPTSMVDGDTYTITTAAGAGSDSVTFLFDKTATVSRAIKINQAGYLPDADVKLAYMGGFLYEHGQLDLAHATTFDVINAATGSSALSGSPSLIAANPVFNQTYTSGTADGTTTNKLIDSGASFTSTVTVGNHAYNVTDDTIAEITNIDSDTQLTIDVDRFISGEDYAIVQFGVDPNDDEMYGEDVYKIDFSALTTPGSYYIQVPGVGRSWPFDINASVYGDVFFTQMRGLYHQRAGIEYTTKYTHWGIPKSQRGPYWYESEYIERTTHLADDLVNKNFEIIGYTALQGSRVVTEGPGGWHDAADFDSRQGHLHVVADLLNAYELRSTELTDSQLHIPESGDGVPDILSEARYGLELYRLMQAGDGGVSGRLETNTHNQRDNTDHITVKEKNHTVWGFGQSTRWDSAVFAACAAQYSRLVAPFDSTDSTLYETAAIDAFDFAANAANSLGGPFNVNGATLLGKGTPYTVSFTETDDYSDVYLMWAKCQLYLATEDETYITDAPSVATLEGQANTLDPLVWQFTEKDYSVWIYYSIIQAKNAGATSLNTIGTTWTDWFTDKADVYKDRISTPPYQCTRIQSLSTSLGLGTHKPYNDNAILWIAYEITGTDSYRQAAIQNSDWAYGCNANGMSWTCGIGYVYPINIQHAHSERDGLIDPVPGIVIYGISNSPIYNNFRDNVWRSKLPGDGLVTSLTQTGGTATCTMVADHGLTTGDKVWSEGAVETEYNSSGDTGKFTVTVSSAKVFTYAVDSGASSPATGTPVFYRYWPGDSHENPPIWRRYSAHYIENVSQGEFTIQETMGKAIFNAAMMVPTGWTPSNELKYKEPRADSRVWGQWYL